MGAGGGCWVDRPELHGVWRVLETNTKRPHPAFLSRGEEGGYWELNRFWPLSWFSQTSWWKLTSSRWGGNWEMIFQCKVYQITLTLHHPRAPRAPGLLLAESGNRHNFYCANFFLSFFTWKSTLRSIPSKRWPRDGNRKRIEDREDENVWYLEVLFKLWLMQTSLLRSTSYILFPGKKWEDVSRNYHVMEWSQQETNQSGNVARREYLRGITG